MIATAIINSTSVNPYEFAMSHSLNTVCLAKKKNPAVAGFLLEQSRSINGTRQDSTWQHCRYPYKSKSYRQPRQRSEPTA